jgi:hypothetical protein
MNRFKISTQAAQNLEGSTLYKHDFSLFPGIVGARYIVPLRHDIFQG